MIKWNFSKEKIENLEKYFNTQIKNGHGSYNKFCPDCYYRNGHPLNYCYKCGGKMIVFDNRSITNREWILAAIDVRDKLDRLSEVICFYWDNRFLYDQYNNERKKYKEENNIETLTYEENDKIVFGVKQSLFDELIRLKIL